MKRAFSRGALRTPCLSVLLLAGTLVSAIIPGGETAMATAHLAGITAQSGTAQAPTPSSGPDSASAPAVGLTEGTWQWLWTEHGDGSTVTAQDPSRYTIAFSADGTLAIRADCNQVLGTYIQQPPATAMQQEAELAIQLGPSTLAACPPDSQADVFLADLSMVASYRFSGQDLVLGLQPGGAMTFEAQPVASLTETSWSAQSYNNGRGGVTTLLPQTEMTASFGVDGTVSGSAGCNSYRGRYTVDGTALSIGPLATTRMACAEPVMEQEQAFLAALQASSQFTLTANELTLRDASGATQAIFVTASTTP